MIKKIINIYERENFNPRLIGLFINPYYLARKGLYQNISGLITGLKGRLLDVGCGSKPYQTLCSVDEYIGLEIDNAVNRKNKKADYYYDGTKMPFSDKEFDSLMLNQVFEHVFNPSDFLKEVNRVTKNGGIILLTAPFVWDEHEQPFDYARYSSFGLMHILKEHGFEILESRKTNNGFELIFQLINAYFYKKIKTKNIILNLLFTVLLMAPNNILGLFFSKVFPRNDDLYLDNIILAKKVNDA